MNLGTEFSIQYVSELLCYLTPTVPALNCRQILSPQSQQELQLPLSFHLLIVTFCGKVVWETGSVATLPQAWLGFLFRSWGSGVKTGIRAAMSWCTRVHISVAVLLPLACFLCSRSLPVQCGSTLHPGRSRMLTLRSYCVASVGDSDASSQPETPSFSLQE